MSSSFQHITPDGSGGLRRHYSPQLQREVVNIQAGDCYVTSKDEVITTVLGSCIAACVRDPDLRIGGMNHFMLPEGAGGGSGDPDFAMRYGAFAMEYLVNELIRQGGKRQSLEVKLFGGAAVMASLSDVGKRNIEFVRRFLATEGYRILAEDLGDTVPRRVKYFPHTGKAMVKRLAEVSTSDIVSREKAHMRSLGAAPRKAETTDIELF